MLEKVYRQNLVKALKAAGKEAFPIESATSPGFPDLVVAGCTMSLVELKVVATRASKTKLHDLFGAPQRAFFKRWWTTGAGGLWLGLYDERAKVYQAVPLCPGLLEKALAEVMPYGYTEDSVTALVERWRNVL